MLDLLTEPDDPCECELPGAYHCGVPGILVWLEQGLIAAGVESDTESV